MRRLQAVLLVVPLCVALAACGEETPLRAIYEIAHELEHEDSDTENTRCVRELGRSGAYALLVRKADRAGR